MPTCFKQYSLKLQLGLLSGGFAELDCDVPLFDNDGTLIETEPRIAAARRAAFEAHGLQAPTMEACRGKTRAQVGELCRGLFSGPDLSRFEAAWQGIGQKMLTALYDALEGDLTTEDLFPDVREHPLLTDPLLQGRRAIVTNAYEPWRAALSRNRALQPFYASFGGGIHGPCEQKAPKPDPALCLHAAQVTRAEQPVLFGDSMADVRAACAATMPVVFLVRGGVLPPELQGLSANQGVYPVRDFGSVRVL